MTTTTQLIETPASLPGGAQCQQLGYIDAYDAVTNSDYAFVAFKETDDSGWRVRIASPQGFGAVFEPALLRSQARAASAQGKPWFTWGFCMDPTATDRRCVHFRVHVDNGQPREIEMFLQMRQFNGEADSPRSTRFAWPQ